MLRRARGLTSSTFFDSEEGRAFLQERLAFYNKVCFLISGSFFLASLALTASGVAPPERVSRGFQERAVALHAATLAVELAAFLLCARRPRLRPGTLRAVDIGALWLVCVGFALQAVNALGSPRLEPTGAFPRATLVLILTNVVLARAVFVPSSALWTAAVSGACALVVTTLIALFPSGASEGAPAVAIWSAMWAACAVVVATLASRVIYGLRQEVREARRLGQYTLEEKLGEGGMGAVYRARHAMLRRPTAIKLLRPDKAGSADTRALRARGAAHRAARPTPTRSRSSTTAARRTASSTTRWSTSTAPTSTRSCERTARSRPGAWSTCCGRWPRRSRRRTGSA